MRKRIMIAVVAVVAGVAGAATAHAYPDDTGGGGARCFIFTGTGPYGGPPGTYCQYPPSFSYWDGPYG
jgi:hypothetical protein